MMFIAPVVKVMTICCMSTRDLSNTTKSVQGHDTRHRKIESFKCLDYLHINTKLNKLLMQQKKMTYLHPNEQKSSIEPTSLGDFIL